MAVFWRPQMSVGNTLVDNDHRYLLCLVNVIELGLASGGNPDVLKLTLQQLVDYTHEHFAREEKLQLKVRYPGYAEHKAEHQELLAKLEQARDRILDLAQGGAAAGGSGEVTSEELGALLADDAPAVGRRPEQDELVRLLREWILEHVLTTDIKLKPYLSRYPENLL